MSGDVSVPMEVALEEARLALAHGDVPVGAVVTRRLEDGPGEPPFFEVVGRGHNRREVDQDPTAHAEILALRDAAAALGTWRLTDCQLVVTLEPCAMCAGAAVLARVHRIAFGAVDPKAGAAGSLWNIPEDPRLNHRPDVIGGVLGVECGALLRDFFRDRR